MKQIILSIIICLSFFSCTITSNNKDLVVNDIPFKMVYVKGGTFQMGYDKGEKNERPIHSVFVNSFYIGETEVTQDLWESIMGTNPGEFDKGDNYPVSNVHWFDAVMFCNKLSEMFNLPKVYNISCIYYNNKKAICSAYVTTDFSKRGFRLPTEAEWEFAARGGTNCNFKYSGSNDADEVACYSQQPVPIKSKKPNYLGLYDMSNNVWEWCNDRYDPLSNYYVISPSKNPHGPNTQGWRVLRGGYNDPVYRRSYHHPGEDGRFIGLRIVLVP